MKLILPVALVLASCATPVAPRFPADQALARMEKDVRFLASDEMKGRNNATPEGLAAAEYVAKQMEAAGLRPGGENGTWFQAIPGKRGDRGRNVIGRTPGESDKWIVIGAHHDGLGVLRDKIHNGADDNASGVAVILEVARRLAGRDGLLFCSFDAEEDGLVGSNHFVKSELYPVSSFRAMICLDLVGGSLLPGDEKRVFALGSESSAFLFDWIGRERDKPDLQVERAGIYAIEPMGPAIARSDYSPFRLKKVPFVFLSTGTPWYYHTPHDDVERLDFPKMGRIADLVGKLAIDTAQGNPEWRDPEPNVYEDAEVLKDSCRRVLENAELRISDARKGMVADALEALSDDPDKLTIQRTMMMLFELAAAQKPAH
jgi:hypothetical protein